MQTGNGEHTALGCDRDFDELNCKTSDQKHLNFYYLETDQPRISTYKVLYLYGRLMKERHLIGMDNCGIFRKCNNSRFKEIRASIRYFSESAIDDEAHGGTMT